MSETTTDRKEKAAGLAARIARMGARLADLRKTMPLRQRLGGGLSQGLLSAAAAIIAYLPTQAVGVREGFWAAITAIAVSQTELDVTRTTARDQVAGAAIGGAMGVVVVLTTGQHLASYLLAVVLSVVACWLLNIGSAGRLGGITATIIILVPHTGTPEHMLASRLGEVAWGAAVAFALVWLRSRLTRPHPAPP